EATIALAKHDMQSVIETGARFLLDPRRKHEPTLVSDPATTQPLRIEFLCRAIDAAAALGSDCVSLWTGAVHDGAPRDEAMERLTGGLTAVLNYADHMGVTLGFEPEPGMLIDTMDAYAELLDRCDSSHLGLTLDVGHLHCAGEQPIPHIIRQWRRRIVNVHIEDMRRGQHEHLMFGEGEMDFPPIVAAFAEIKYHGGLHVELSRHSHEGPAAAERAFQFLNPLVSVATL
ncbi:MAG TPA: sugar phosphate isomerase/epimerase family protein, partial [Lacipirellulaceae bacterium]|nr:sugar phosphate isomerase/epimerase family protein [Lacipirellulaceae bacterium]